jgi:hypothetical protein
MFILHYNDGQLIRNANLQVNPNHKGNKLVYNLLHNRIRNKVDRGLLDQISLDQNCLFSVDRKFHFQLIKFFETFQLIEKFDQLPKKNLRILAVDRNF